MFNDFLIKYNGGELNIYNHERDNSFLDCKNITAFRQYVKDNDFLYLGLTDKYDYTNIRATSVNLAIVFKNKNDEVFWCHWSSIGLCSWIERELQLNGYSNDSVALYSKACEILNKFFDDNDFKNV